MERGKKRRVDCAAMVGQLNQELDWGLTVEQQRNYCCELETYLSEVCSRHLLRTIVCIYHQDHALVQALSDKHHDLHEESWQYWMGQVGAILKHAGLAWSTDVAVDLDDLMQTAIMAMIRSIPTFQYRSRFSTWAYQVIIRSVQRYIRYCKADKRAVIPDSLDLMVETDMLPYQDAYLEAKVDGALLLQRVADVLADQPDRRLYSIFHCWALQAWPTADIARHVSLHPSRVRTLLGQTRSMLRQHSAIRNWHGLSEC